MTSLRRTSWDGSNPVRRTPSNSSACSPGFPTSRVVSFTDKCPAGVEPARPPWQGGRLPLHHGHYRRPRIVKEPRAPGGTRTHVPALRVRSLRRWTTSACIGVGPEGLEPSPNRLRAGRSAARTSVPIGVASRPGRSRTSAARLSAECSPVELQAVAARLSRWSAPGELNPSSLAYKASALPVELGAMGPEGFEPPPTGLKGRHAAATPRPRSGHLMPGYSFGPDHRLGPRYGFCRKVRAAGFEPAVSSPPSLRIGQAFPRPDRSCE